jgi:hypothetical protein
MIRQRMVWWCPILVIRQPAKSSAAASTMWLGVPQVVLPARGSGD